MKNKAFIGVIAASLVPGQAAMAQNKAVKATADRPNIIFILADDVEERERKKENSDGGRDHLQNAFQRIFQHPDFPRVSRSRAITRSVSHVSRRSSVFDQR